MKNYTAKRIMKALAEDERPREKLINKGPQILSNSELLAILIGSGNTKMNALEIAKVLMEASDHSIRSLMKKSHSELQHYEGIGSAKATVILAALELSKRSMLEEAKSTLKIQSSRDAFSIIKPHLYHLQVEEFWVAYLDRSNKVLSLKSLSKGGVHGTVVDIRLILKNAINMLASGLILFHNHPSGNLKPSNNDDKITKQISDAGKLVDILILDHLIVNDNHYYSYADEGKI